MIFEYNLTVRGYELDSYNHVNNAVYLNYMEQARWEMLKEVGLLDAFRKRGLLLVVTEIHVRYSQESKVFDTLQVRTTVEAKEPYIIFKHKIVNAETGVKLTSAEVKSLLIDGNRVAESIPNDFYTMFGQQSPAEKQAKS